MNAGQLIRAKFQNNSKNNGLVAAIETVLWNLWLGHMFARAVAIGGVFILLAYVFQLEIVWRPIANGPAASPFTAILFIATGVALASTRAFVVPQTSVLILSFVSLLSALRLYDIASDNDLGTLTAPFSEVAQNLEGRDLSILTGWNTAVMFLCISTSVLLRRAGYAWCAQGAGMMGLSLPLVALTGYLYGITNFYGDMSLTTVIGGILIASATLLRSGRTGFVRAISSPWDSGKYSRLEILILTLVAFGGGFAIQLLLPHSQTSGVPVFVVLMSTAATITIGSCAVVLERNDQMRRRAERIIADMATNDALTGLYNRRFLDEHQCNLVANAKNRGAPISVLMIDVDRFKAVNDTYGHAAGDEALRQISNTINKRIRSSDIAVRYGGEELLVLLLNANVKNAEVVANDIRKQISKIDFSEVASKVITVSIGVAELATTMSEAIGSADDALYKAKRSGRNKVVTSTNEFAATTNGALIKSSEKTQELCVN